MEVDNIIKQTQMINMYKKINWDDYKLKELNYTCYHNHTEYSNLRLIDCINKVEKLIDQAIELGHKGVAITDHECISGHVRAVKYVKELKEKKKVDEDFQLILGNEIYLIDNLDTIKEDKKEGKKDYYHFILLAKNEIGYKQLRALSARAWLNLFKTGKMERVPIEKRQLEEIIGDDKGHLAVTSACLGGEVADLTFRQLENPTNENKVKLVDFFNWSIRTFGRDNFYIEIQPRKGSIDQRDFNREIIRIAKACKLKWLFNTDTHYYTKEFQDIHEAFLNSKEGDREVQDFYETTYMMDKKELIALLSQDLDKEDIIEGIGYSEHLRKQIDDIDMYHRVIIPEIPISDLEAQVHHDFKMFYDEYEYIEKFAYSNSKQDRFLLRKIEEGFKSKNQIVSQKTIGRINEELETLWTISDNLNQRLSSYYVLTRDTILEVLWKDDMGDSLVGIARGSVTGCYFAYLIDITQMNPLDWDLPFWRHLHVSRPELPKPIYINWALVVNLCKKGV